MIKPRLILDQDDVLADTHRKLAEIVLHDFGTDFTHDDLYKGPFQEILSSTDQKKLYKCIHQPGFFIDIPLVAHAQEAVLELSHKYEIFVATAAMEFPNSFREKYDWLKQYFEFIPWSNIVFCGDKSVLNGDVLIDDMPRNLKTFNGEGLLFNAPHNLKETDYERVMNWEEILSRLL